MGLKLSDFVDCNLCEHYKNNACILGVRNKGIDTECMHFKQRKTVSKWELNLDDALRFMLAGDSEFVLVSGKTGRTFQYRLVKKNNQKDCIYWVYAEDLYSGIIYFNTDGNEYMFSKGTKGHLNKDDIRMVSLLFTLNKLHNHRYNTNIKVYHLGICGKCRGRLCVDKARRTGLCNLCRVDVIKEFG